VTRLQLGRAPSCALSFCPLALLVLVASPSAHATTRGSEHAWSAPERSLRGRILCEVTASVASGKLVWVDALVVQAPHFARALRFADRSAVDPASELAASRSSAPRGLRAWNGPTEVRVRGVLCQPGPNGEWCGPETVEASAVVAVGRRPLRLRPRMAKSVDDRGRGARMARRDEGAYSLYVTEEQRSQPG